MQGAVFDMVMPDEKETTLFWRALIFSLLLHLLLLVVVVPQQSPKLVPIEVALLQPTPVTSQIVSPPDNRSEKAPENATRKSDYNAITEKEQIKRGLPDSSSQPPTPPTPPSKAVAMSKPAEAPAAKPSPPKSKTAAKLKLDSDDLEKTLAALQNEEDVQTKTKQPAPQRSMAEERERIKTEQQLTQRAPYSKGASSLYHSKPGLPDYLPDLPDGDITLLNAKADQYAVFVRRVAMQVFGAIRKRNWQELSFNETQSITHFVIVEAVMSPKGELKNIKLIDSSGSNKFDDILKSSARDGAWDQNPPGGALADDGNIHFIFKSRTWARRTGDIRFEQRWLLLGTGLL